MVQHNIENNQQKKYNSEVDILQYSCKQLSGKSLHSLFTTSNMMWNPHCLDEGEILFIEPEKIFPSRKGVKTFRKRRNSIPKMNSICQENSKYLLDIYLRKRNIISTEYFISPDYTCQISLMFNGKNLQSQSPQSPNKKIAQYEASKDMLKQLSFYDDKAMKIYRKIDKTYFRYGSVVDFTENHLIEFKASDPKTVPQWNRIDLQGTLKGKPFRSFAHYICAFLNSKKGGSIYYGIHDLGQAFGYYLNEKDRDQIIQSLSSQIKGSFSPALGKDLVSFYFHPVEVEDKFNNLIDKKNKNPPKEIDYLPPSIQEYVVSIQNEKDFLLEALETFMPRKINSYDVTEKSGRFILEISVAKNETGKVYRWKEDAFEKIENSIAKMRPKMIRSPLKNSHCSVNNNNYHPFNMRMIIIFIIFMMMICFNLQ